VWLKGEPGKDGTLRTAEIRHLSVSRQPSVTAMSDRETSPQGADMTGPAISEAGRRICPMCGGTGTQKIMQWITVMEPQTVYEQVTQFQFGKPVNVTVPRTVQKAVQKPDYKMVPRNRKSLARAFALKRSEFCFRPGSQILDFCQSQFS